MDITEDIEAMGVMATMVMAAIMVKILMLKMSKNMKMKSMCKIY